MTQIAIYVRKSKMSEKGESIQNQITICQEYASQSYSDCHFFVFQDDGYSGGTISRPGFYHMMEEIKSGKIDVVVCYKLDRISRNVSDFSAILECFNQHHTAFLSVKERFDTSCPMGRAMMYISSVFAQLERETIAERIQDNIKKLERTGRWLGGVVPTGFCSGKLDYIDESGNRKKQTYLIPNEKEKNLVLLLFEKYLELGGLKELLSYVASHNIKTKNNHFFTLKSLKKILTNPVYVKSNADIFYYYQNLGCDMVNSPNEYNGNGLFILNRYSSKAPQKPTEEWIIVLGIHKGWIKPQDFIKIQTSLKETSFSPPRLNTSASSLCSSLILCPQCGSKMTVTHKTSPYEGKKYYYYRCCLKRNSNGTSCSMKNLNGALIDQILVQTINQFIQSNQRELIHQLKTTLFSNKKSIPSREPQQKEQQKETLRKINNLTKQLEKNKNSTAAKYIIAQIENLDQKLNPVPSITMNSYQEHLNRLKTFTYGIDSLSFAEKRNYIHSFIKKIEIQKNCLLLHLK